MMENTGTTNPLTAGEQTPASGSSPDVYAAYDGSNVLFQLLRMTTWGPGLMNLGWFNWRGPLAWLNLFVNLETRQQVLVRKSLDLLQIHGPDRVLDVACGRGKSSFILHCLYPEASIVALDLLEKNIEVAKLLFGCSPRLSYQPGNAMHLDFESESFNHLHCLEAAFHFPDRRRFLKEACRVLKPGGRCVVVDFAWKRPEDRDLENPRTQVVRDVWQYDDMFAVDEYKSAAREAGFTLAAAHDWSRRVTAPFQATFDTLLAMRKSRWLWQRVLKMNPMFKGFSDRDWEQLAEISRAQDHVRRRTNYMAFVFQK